jgi:hypothetical protein
VETSRIEGLEWCSSRLEDNIEVCLINIGWECVDVIHCTVGMGSWLASVDMGTADFSHFASPCEICLPPPPPDSPILLFV